MKRVVILTAILALALAGTVWAQPPASGPRLNYLGYVSVDGAGNVNADTLICVFNPNSVPVPVNIHVYSKDGDEVAMDGEFLDGGLPIITLQPLRMGWVTLGQLLPGGTAFSGKMNFVITFIRPTVKPWRGLVAEVKEILYTGWTSLHPEPPPEPPPYNPCWVPSLIRAWSETALCKGKGAKGGGVGYSK